jgi:hypothetical protein
MTTVILTRDPELRAYVGEHTDALGCITPYSVTQVRAGETTALQLDIGETVIPPDLALPGEPGFAQARASEPAFVPRAERERGAAMGKRGRPRRKAQ